MTQLPNLENPLRIGTRASPLALAQAHMTRAALMAAHALPEEAFQIVAMTATGDRILDRALAEVGGKALWTRELDFALDALEIDIAVHSLKDVETERDARFALCAMLERADPRDRLVVPEGQAATSILDLPAGTRLGTSSPRRAAQVRRIRPDIETKLLRGNVQTRLAKLAERDVDATLLAAAGLDRLGMHHIGIVQDRDLLLPAASQGAIGIECRSDDGDTMTLIRAINHAPTFEAVMAERAFLAGLGGDCRSPVAAHAYFNDQGALWLDAEIFSADGADHVASSTIVHSPDSAADLAQQMLKGAAPSIRALFGG